MDPTRTAWQCSRYRFWSAALKSDPTVLGKTIRLGTRTATVIGVLEPSVPYPAETELIANVVTSPHHLSATMVTGREHRMTEIFGRLAPGASLESARAELQTVHAGMVKEHPETYTPKSDFRISAELLRDQITSPRPNGAAGCCSRRPGSMFVDRLFERRQSDSRRARFVAKASSRSAPRSAPALPRCRRHAARREPAAVRHRRRARRRRRADRWSSVLGKYAARFSRARARRDARFDAAVGRRRPGR